MLCRELIEKLEKLAPRELACDWDNPGFLAGRGDKEIKKVLVALDATDRVVEQAVKEKADFLLTHHPAEIRTAGTEIIETWHNPTQHFVNVASFRNYSQLAVESSQITVGRNLLTGQHVTADVA